MIKPDVDKKVAFDLDRDDPIILCFTLMDSLDALLAHIENIEKWSECGAKVLDFAYRTNVSLLLKRHASTDKLHSLALHLDIVISDPARRSALDSFDIHYGFRWAMLLDMLEDLLAARDCKFEADDAYVMNRPYMHEILQLIAKNRASSKNEILNEISGLTDILLDRALKKLENWELVFKHEHGSEEIWLLGPRAKEVLIPLL
ncbi:hypothetical protein ISS03_00335 [Patescibacteria group bacterium]|nr:hypothetical protein [Patescibacteria group bacterium]